MADVHRPTGVGDAVVPAPSPTPLTLRETAAVVGHLAWVESRLFSLLGAWVGQVPELEGKRVLPRHSQHHGWHAQLLVDLLPDLADLRGADQVTPPTSGSIDALGLLDL